MSRPDKAHRVYRYLLKGLTIERPDQVWATDITYIPMHRGWVSLVAIMDLSPTVFELDRVTRARYLHPRCNSAPPAPVFVGS